VRRPSELNATPLTPSLWANEGAEFARRLQLPQLQRVVMGGGNDEPPLRTQRHAIDTIGVAGEGAEYAAGLHLPHL
jgi:hypothetical protein